MGKAREPRSRGAKFGYGPLRDDRGPCCRRAPTLGWCVGFSEIRMAVLIGGEPTGRPAGGSETADAAAAPDPPGRPVGRRVQPVLARSPPAPARHGTHSRSVLPKVSLASGQRLPWSPAVGAAIRDPTGRLPSPELARRPGAG